MVWLTAITYTIVSGVNMTTTDWLLISRAFLGMVGLFCVWLGMAQLLPSHRKLTLSDVVIAFVVMLAGMSCLYGASLNS